MRKEINWIAVRVYQRLIKNIVETYTFGCNADDQMGEIPSKYLRAVEQRHEDELRDIANNVAQAFQIDEDDFFEMAQSAPYVQDDCFFKAIGVLQ
jgi:cobyrinic acid a,c-diamide synthase